MSALQKSILKNKLPPRCPRTSGISKLAPFGASRRKDYSPVSWRQYFAKSVDVETEGGTFRVYLSPEPDHAERPRIVTLHGGGYSGLSWALFTAEITNMIHCQVVSMDIRGHGDTKAKDPEDLSGDTLAKDVEQVLHKLFEGELPPIVLVGHSMGGAVAVRAAHRASLEHAVRGTAVIDVVEVFEGELPPIVLVGHMMGGAAVVRTAHRASLEHAVRGTAVIDVVEGTAMDALASMQSFLRSRPTHFNSVEHAIEWCVRSGQVRNLESARVSMPSQIVNCMTDQLAINEVPDSPSSPEELPSPVTSEPAPPARGSRASSLADRIVEEGEAVAEEGEDVAEDGGGGDPFVAPAAAADRSAMKYRWRIDLSKTERHWSGWFTGLSQAFLSQRAPRLLLLASIDGLDRELTVGQMQGKFQMQVLTRCGHAVHEDSPAEVARVIASFVLRHRLTAATDNGEHMNLVSVPGC